MKIESIIKSAIFVPSCVINGEVCDYTVELTTEIPIFNGDTISFEFPKEIVPPVTATDLNC